MIQEEFICYLNSYAEKIEKKDPGSGIVSARLTDLQWRMKKM